MSNPNQSPNIVRTSLTGAWSTSFLDPLLERLRYIYDTNIATASSLDAISRDLLGLYRDTESLEKTIVEEGDDKIPEVSLDKCVQLIFACLALLEEQARRSEMISSPSNTAGPVGSRQMDNLRTYYGNDFDSVLQATQVRHSILQNARLNPRNLIHVAKDIYRVTKNRFPTLGSVDT